MKTSIRIGCGAGYSGDRIEPAVELAEQGRARLPGVRVPRRAHHRAGAAAQARTIRRPATTRCSPSACGPCCPRAPPHGVRIITNMGAANPLAAAAMVAAVARDARARRPAGRGDHRRRRAGRRRPAASSRSRDRRAGRIARRRLVSANAYLGADADRRRAGAGRRRRHHRPRRRSRRCSSRRSCTSSAGHVDDWPLLGRGTVVGHLLECAGQVTGGYFADPGRQGRRRASRASASRSPKSPRTAVPSITKVPGTGGAITLATCKEQLLYEVDDPAAYVTPDVVADFSRRRAGARWRRPRPRRRARAGTGAGDPEGGGRLSRRLHRRGADFLRRRGRGRAGAAGRARSSRTACG